MRPQHITAENSRPSRSSARRGRRGFNEAAAYHCGKPGPWTCGASGAGFASMRPQHITAENLQRFAHLPHLPAASMRPQHITAENSSAA